MLYIVKYMTMFVQIFIRLSHLFELILGQLKSQWGHLRFNVRH